MLGIRYAVSERSVKPLKAGSSPPVQPNFMKTDKPYRCREHKYLTHMTKWQVFWCERCWPESKILEYTFISVILGTVVGLILVIFILSMVALFG